MLAARPGLPEGARDPHFPKHTTIQLFHTPPPLHRHPSFKRCGMRLCVPGYFSSLHLNQLTDLRLGERDGEGEGRNTSVQNPRRWSRTRFSPTEYIVASVITYSTPPPPPNKKYQRRRDHPTTSPAGSPGETGGIIQRHLPQLPMESGPFILLINLHGDSERKRREKKGSEAERQQAGRTPKNVLDLYLLSHVLQG